MKNEVRILIVDDNPDTARVVSSYLQRKGYQCQVETSAWMALKRLDEMHFDLAIVDILMPEMGGIELLKRIKTLYPQVAVVMLSGMTDVHTATLCLRLGALDYLVKPVDLRKLTASVHRAMEKRNLLIQRRDFQIQLQKEVNRKTEEIQSLFFSTIEALVSALEAKDRYTEGHSRHVTLYSLLIAFQMALNDEIRERIRLAGLLHDIGKIGIPESILNKPGRLTSEEFEQIKRHPEIGEAILAPIPGFEDIRKAIRHHHERFDGKGYPDGLKEHEIPLISRILTVADSYDAMTSTRSYRAALDSTYALEELQRCSGSQFDPEIVKAFMDIRMERSDFEQLVKFSEDNTLWKTIILRGDLK